MIRRHCMLWTLSLVMVILSSTSWAQGGFDDVEIKTTALTGSVFMLTGAGGNMGLCIGDDGTFLIDDQYAPLTEKIVAAVAELTDNPVDFVFNTHYHGDHTGGSIDGMIAGVQQIIDLSNDETRIIPGHGPLIGKAQLVQHLDMLTRARSAVAKEMDKGSDLAAVQAASPCAEWDTSHGQAWLTSDQFVQSIFDSLSDSLADHKHQTGHAH